MFSFLRTLHARAAFALFWTALACGTTARAAAEPAVAPATLPALQAEIARQMDGHIDGAGIALFQGGEPLWIGGLGVADRDSGRRVDGDTYFRIGSITKTLLAIAILREVDAGRLSLDAPLAELAPEIAIDNPWHATDPVRLVHLLEHTAGFDDMHFRNMTRDAAVDVDTLATMQRYATEFRVRWRPGERMAYSNPGYGLASYVLEKTTGRRAEAIITEDVLRRLDMTATRWDKPEDARLAFGYDADTRQRVQWDDIALTTAGALASTPNDMQKLLRWFVTDGASAPDLLSPASLARMQRSETALSARAGVPGYGIGNYAMTRGERAMRGHSGGITGYYANMAYDRAAGIGMLVMYNTLPGKEGRAIQDLLVKFAARGVPATDSEPMLEPDPALTGWYAFDNPRLEVLGGVERFVNAAHLGIEDGKYRLRHALLDDPVDFELLRYGRVRDAGLRSANGAFVTDADGRQLLVTDDNVFVRRSWAAVALPQYLFAAAVATLLIGVLCAPVWAWRSVRGRLRGVAHRNDRWWPVLATLSLAATGFAATGLTIPAVTSRAPDAVQLAIMFGSIAFAVFAAIGSVQALRHLRAPGNRFVRGYSLVASLAALSIAIWLWRIDLLGIRLWAW